MQLILLSGGSGKRLWPLSNNVRSKQFLPLLEKENGTMESMLQRVVGQARETNLTKNITIATNKSQQDIIINQLGNSVNLVTEPERRDTFPAIALSASYLKLEKKCDDDEVVVVMPCDPYTDVEYFHTISRMVKCVEANIADLVLMGITPTYPSEKYGYVVPKSGSLLEVEHFKIQKVSCFTEKPIMKKAKELLAKNAYWNGGVFAFRLGYMMSIVRKYITSYSFEDIRNRYSEFPKISFDYEVVEKADSVAVVPFTGKWKDLGTWNTLTDELRKPIIGNAVMGAHCENTYIINETQLPIYADGLNNIVVVACPNGILVCSKEHSEEIKNVVEQLTSRPMCEDRRWGICRVLDDTKYANGNHSLTKSVTLNPGKNISYHIHHHYSEVWTFIEGEGIFVMDGVEKKVKAGDTVIIPVDCFYAIKALTQLSFIEVQSGRGLIEEDIERFDYEWR